MPAALFGKGKTIVYLHGLGKDSFMKFDNTDNAEINAVKQFEHIHVQLAKQNVIRVVFKSTDNWEKCDSSCVNFHQEVKLFVCFHF
jgi:hypothetical protein